jgi:catechol 2,3-dioxygenase-like lactoylglutathione lyase family enzyme
MPSAPRTADCHNALRHHAVVGLSGKVLRDFYGHLGFTDLVVEEIPDAVYIQALTGGAWSSAVIVKLRNEDGDILEIIEPQGLVAASDFSMVTSWAHIAIAVTNCDLAAREAVGMGGTEVGGPVINPDSPYKVAYVRDPAGNLIELVQRLKHS